MLASFVFRYTWLAVYSRSDRRSSKSSGLLLCTCDETVTTRAGADAFRVSRSRFVRRNGARWLTANWVSRPSTVMRLRRVIVPALLMRTWSWGVLGCERSCQLAYGALRREVGDEEVDILAAGVGAYLGLRGLAAFEVSADHDDSGAHSRQACRRRLADAGVRARDEAYFTGHVRLIHGEAL